MTADLVGVDLTGADRGGPNRGAWSRARLSAAVAAARLPDRHAPLDGLLGDEIEFLTSIGTRREVPPGVTLIRGEEKVREVHLIVRGAAALVSDRGERRPILGFRMPDELCGPVPLLLGEPALWDAVTVTDSTVIAVPAAPFTTAVQDHWVDRWSTRCLVWLATMGARSADLDCDLTGQTAALLLRQRCDVPLALCQRTIADLLDTDEGATGPILLDFERVGAVRLTGGRIRVTQVEILKSIVREARSRTMRNRFPHLVTG
jgi:CRP-like cAMP-binding protein